MGMSSLSLADSASLSSWSFAGELQANGADDLCAIWSLSTVVFRLEPDLLIEEGDESIFLAKL